MSDHNERACHRCGSLLHHEDVCPQERPRLPRACVRCGSYYHYTENCNVAVTDKVSVPAQGSPDLFRARFEAFYAAELARMPELEVGLPLFRHWGAETPGPEYQEKFLLAATLFETIRKMRRFMRKDEFIAAIEGIWDMVENDEREGVGEVGVGEPREKKRT